MCKTSQNIFRFTSKKGFAPILILVVLLVIGVAAAVGLYFVTKNPSSKPATPIATQDTATIKTPAAAPDETASWKTYVSRDNSFSFQYPQTLSLKEGGYVALAFTSDPNDPYFQRTELFYVDKADQETADTAPGTNIIDVWPLKNVGDISKTGLTRQSDITIDGQIGRVYTDGSTKEIIVKKGVYYYRIMMYITPEMLKLNDEFHLSDQILSTFKFTD